MKRDDPVVSEAEKHDAAQAEVRAHSAHHAESPAALAAEWGWKNPDKTVIKIAGQVIAARNTVSAQLLVEMGVIGEEQKERLLKSKPPTIQTIAWIAQKNSAVVPYVERLLAYKAGYPYYEVLSVLSIHACMQIEAVMKRADEIDAVVMMIEETVPVLVFSSFGTLIRFKSMGRADRHLDPIITNTGSELRLAVGVRDEISVVLTKNRSADPSSPSVESANVWSTASADNTSKPENREITRIVDDAISMGATDIALKPARTGALQVQVRKFGDMVSPASATDHLHPEMAAKVVSRLAMKSGANPQGGDVRVPLDGQITYRSGVGDAFLRLSFIPMHHLGELRNLTSVSIRIMPRKDSPIRLQDLRLAPDIIDEIRFAMRGAEGLVLLVGPTNSGKSTTIAGAIGEHVALFGDKRKRLSVEDPIERYVYGVQQYSPPPSVRGDADRFEIMLRAFKRHDPDLIWVGEVRDKVTADLCVSSSSTGHIVLATLHAKDVVMGVDVLAKTIKPELILQMVESLALVVSQRLVKELCPRCHKAHPPTDAERRLFGKYTLHQGEEAELPDSIASVNLDGCKSCWGGYVREVPINEMLPFGRKAKDAAIAMLLEGARHRASLAALRPITLLGSGLRLLAEGRVELRSLLV
ncbi:MAG: ATPase, T2SS/T4P/T4SS family [Proteobacteria bacterium]|nr:ATPase, T2SS/T4P/T4SS family [Pseudomonadota bacterium]